MPSPAPAVLVVIANSANCYVDGVNVGQPLDAIANNPAAAAEIQTALTAFEANEHT